MKTSDTYTTLLFTSLYIFEQTTAYKGQALL